MQPELADLLEAKLGKQQKKTRFSLGKLKAGYIALAGVLTGVIVAAFGKAIKKASDFEEANQKFGVTFRGVSKEANKMRKDLIKSYGLSSLAATDLLASTGDLLTGFGFTRESALDLSGQVQKLSVDLASFQNLQGGAERASADSPALPIIQKAITPPIMVRSNPITTAICALWAAGAPYWVR